MLSCRTSPEDLFFNVFFIFCLYSYSDVYIHFLCHFIVLCVSHQSAADSDSRCFSHRAAGHVQPGGKDLLTHHRREKRLRFLVNFRSSCPIHRCFFVQSKRSYSAFSLFPQFPLSRKCGTVLDLVCGISQIGRRRNLSLLKRIQGSTVLVLLVIFCCFGNKKDVRKKKGRTAGRKMDKEQKIVVQLRA